MGDRQKWKEEKTRRGERWVARCVKGEGQATADGRDDTFVERSDRIIAAMNLSDAGSHRHYLR